MKIPPPGQKPPVSHAAHGVGAPHAGSALGAVETPGASHFEPRAGLVSSLRRQQPAAAPATLLTADDLGLPPGPPAIPAKAIVADALELLKESGVSTHQALTLASARLGLKLPPELSSLFGHPAWMALGPASLPFIPPKEVPLYLRQWPLRLAEVLPTVLEHAKTAPDLYPERLAALARNPSLTDAEAMTLHDVRVRTELGRRPVGPDQSPHSLASMLNQVSTLPDGPLLGDSAVLAARLLERGHVADPGQVQQLADRALSSSDASARAKAGHLFWRSSYASEPGLKAYLRSVFAPGSERWTRDRLNAAVEAFERDPTWSRPTTTVESESAYLAMGGLLRGAPAHAELGPLVESLMWPSWRGSSEWVELADFTRSAIEWSTTPAPRRIAAADTLKAVLHEGMGELAMSRRASRLLSGLLAEHPELAAEAPKLLSAQVGAKATPEELASAVKRLAQAPDYFAELGRMKAELEALDDYPRAVRHGELRAINDVLTPPTPETAFEALTSAYQASAFEKVKELGISNQVVFDEMVDRSPALATHLLSLPGLSEQTYREHMTRLLQRAGKLDAQEALAALVSQRVSREAVIDILTQGHQAGLWPKLGVELIEAGFSRQLVLALTGSPKVPPPLQVTIEPSNELARGLGEIRRSRMADFRGRATREAPYRGAAPEQLVFNELRESDLASLVGADEAAALKLVSRERLQATKPELTSAVKALLTAGPESLDFVMPTVTATITEELPLVRTFAPILELMSSPKVSKAAALKLAWSLAESSSRQSSHWLKVEYPGNEETLRAVFNTVLRFADQRSDLSELERAELKQALGYLAKSMPFVTRPY